MPKLLKEMVECFFLHNEYCFAGWNLLSYALRTYSRVDSAYNVYICIVVY